MSTFVQVDVTCDRCGATSQRVVATSINATRTPEWRQVILDGSFQRSECPACAAVATPLVPFPYIDFDRKQYLGVFPPQDEARWWEVEREPHAAYVRNLGDLAPPVARPLGAGFEVRTVFGLGALREKIVVLSSGLDDAVLEALKLRLLLARPELDASLDGRPRLVEVAGGTLGFEVAVPSSEEEHDLYRLEVPSADYDDVARDQALRPVVQALRAGPYRDCGRLLEPAPGDAAAGAAAATGS